MDNGDYSRKNVSGFFPDNLKYLSGKFGRIFISFDLLKPMSHSRNKRYLLNHNYCRICLDFLLFLFFFMEDICPLFIKILFHGIDNYIHLSQVKKFKENATFESYEEYNASAEAYQQTTGYLLTTKDSHEFSKEHLLHGRLKYKVILFHCPHNGVHKPKGKGKRSIP